MVTLGRGAQKPQNMYTIYLVEEITPGVFLQN